LQQRSTANTDERNKIKVDRPYIIILVGSSWINASRVDLKKGAPLVVLETSEGTLDILVAYLKDTPTHRTAIGSHTDSRGNEGYNLALSGARALESRKYLDSQGIASERLEAKVFGESQLKNRCANGVSCSEAEHLLTRRSEFISLIGISA